jgi:hypothetical protein
VLSVECKWSEEDEAAAAAEAMQEQPAHNPTESVEELLSALRSATSLPSDAISAEVHIAFPGAAASAAIRAKDDSNPWRRASLPPLSFAFVPVRQSGATHATLVKRRPHFCYARLLAGCFCLFTYSNGQKFLGNSRRSQINTLYAILSHR